MANRYPFNIEWSDEDQEYIATCPAFPGLSAFGETEEKALKEGKTALAGFIKSYKANNMALPEPKMHETVSGKFQLRLPKSLHRLAVGLAHLEGVSLNSYIADAVRARVAGDQLGNRVLNEVRQLVAQIHTATACSTGENLPVEKDAENTIHLAAARSKPRRATKRSANKSLTSRVMPIRKA